MTLFAAITMVAARGPRQASGSENPPSAISPVPVPGPDHAAPGNRVRGPARRRRAGWILTALAVAAVAVVVIVLGVVKPRTGNQSPAANDGSPALGGATATVSGSLAAVPAVVLPTVGKTLAVGQGPSYVEVAPNGKFAYVTDVGAKAITVLDTVTGKVSRIVRIPEGPPQFVSFSADGKTAYVSVYKRIWVLLPC